MDLTWDVQLTLAPQAFPSLQLGASKLRRTSWLWRGSQAQSQGGSHSSRARDNLVFDPPLQD